MLRRWMLLCVIILIVGPINAQEDEDTLGLRLVDTVALSDLDIPENWSRISPDGSTIAYLVFSGNNLICLYTIDSAETTCTDIDDLSPHVEYFIWSPDGQVIALVSYPLVTARDADVLLFDVGTNTVINRTDDGFDGRIFGVDDNPDVPVDHSLVWAHDTGDLFFMRYQPARDTDSLMRIPGPGAGPGMMGMGAANQQSEILTETPPEIIWTRPGDLDPIPVAASRFSYNYFDGPLTISPDGTRMAVSVTNRRRDHPMNGIWIIDIASGDGELVVPVEDIISVGVPDPLEATTISGLEWIGGGILVWHESGDMDATVLNSTIVFVDDTTLDITPVIDLTPIDDVRTYFSRDETGGILWPRSFVVTPDESTLIYAGLPNLPDGNIVWGLSLPVTPDAVPVSLVTFSEDDMNTYGGGFASIGGDETRLRVLMNSFLLTFSYE